MMALAQLFRVFLSRWPAVVIGALCTAGAMLGVLGAEGAYWSRTSLVFLAPSSELFPNSLQTRSEDLIITAGLVAKRVNGPDKVQKFASTETTLVGIPGTTDGVWLRLPDSGGQWAPSFADQFLLLDVMGDSADEVRAKQLAVIDRAREELDLMQREQNVDPVNDITLKVAPETPPVFHVTGSRIRSLGMTAAVGLGATLAAIVALEQRSRRIRLPDDQGTRRDST
ncbi:MULTISPECIES: hypothetical protein [unclassified Microbacterium]|uniref:hypothetical protein n=1 Tax=unclassified Microbacterium TaxID=2609290 RepID=UPI00214AA3DC|nr:MULTISPECIES: hypothetical protein [unclassified Microbacterium]MCR2785002.1 hypothetical protein [Microbacterium sp. zg.B96]WIM16541.1 hypothetical protein QNO11_02555 [Microbacterium sp. zg-B96]